ncbi:hypothetical protein DSECCO2_436050 [anaerobic digester metagenome]
MSIRASKEHAVGNDYAALTSDFEHPVHFFYEKEFGFCCAKCQPVIDVVFINAPLEGRVCKNDCKCFFSAVLV